MPPDLVKLDYAPPDPRRGRRARRLLWVVLGVIVIYLGVEHLPGLATRGRVMWIQGQCGRFDFPAETVVFDSDRPAGLVADAENYVVVDDASVWPVTGVTRREPGCWSSLKREMFGLTQFWPPGPGAPKALVHGFRSAGGEERLVAVILAPRPRRSAQWAATTEPAGDLGLVAALVRPGDWSQSPRWSGNGAFLPCFKGAKRLKVFAARLDPADASRFTIAYEMDGQVGTIEGKFDEMSGVVMTVRDGPARGTDSE